MACRVGLKSTKTFFWLGYECNQVGRLKHEEELELMMVYGE